ncbi:MAG: hypothetical protein HY716_07940 [Planctomycetes bacterium]|nr:hypothetical protein [Planctomycetota bacterium]
MRYQIRLTDQNLPGLAREIALACWPPIDAYVPRPTGPSLYRALYRAVRGALRARLEAFRYCGAAPCDHWLRVSELGEPERQEVYPPELERVRRFIARPGTTPPAIVSEILRGMLLATVKALPSVRLKGLARLLRREIEKILRGRVYRSEVCGELAICQQNEPYDPWDLRDPINRVPKEGVKSA